MGWLAKNAVLRRPSALQIVGQAIQPCSSGGGVLATAVRVQGKIAINFGPWPVTDFRVPVVGWYIPGGLVKTSLPKAYTCNFALEPLWFQATTSPDVLWGGVAQKVVTPGDELAVSDNWCAVNGNIPAGAKAFLRFDITVPTASMLSQFALQGSNSGPYIGLTYWFTTTGAATNSINGIGALSGTGSGGNQLTAPILLHAVLAKYDYLRTSALVLGDSKTAGTGTTDNLSGKSYITRALYDLGVPLINYGFAGTLLQQWAALPATAYAHAPYTSDCFIGFPINDITGNRTLTQIQADLTTLVTTVKSVNPSIKVWALKTEPHTTSTDAWATTVNQAGTGNAVFPGSVRDLYNAWLDTQVGGLLTGVLDPNTLAEYGGSGASGIWPAGSTTDGLHPIDSLISNIAIDFKKQLLSKGFIPNTGTF